MAIYRSVRCDTMEDLRDVSVQAERVYLRLALGRFSTRTALVKYNARDLAAEARVRPSELESALVELCDAGMLLRADNAPAVYLLGFCYAFAPRPVDNRRAWVADIDAFKYENLSSQARKEIEDATGTAYPVPTQRVASAKPVPAPQEQEQEQEQEQNSTTTLFPPTATATADAEPLELPLKQARQVRELTPAQQTAILNRKLAYEAVREWNAIIAPFNAPCIPTAQWERQTASVVAKAVAALGSVDAFGGLCEWARARSEYYSGRIYRDRNGAEHRKTWTMGEWCASYNIEKMFAKCRQDSLDLQQREPVFTYDPTRKPSLEMLPAPKAAA